MKAVVNKMIGSLRKNPDVQSELIDEVLYGMVVTILEETNSEFVYVKTHYHYEGYILKENLYMSDATNWAQEKNAIITQKFADVLLEAKIQSNCIVTLSKGAHIKWLTIYAENNEWSEVELVNGQRGFVRTEWLKENVKLQSNNEAEFRQNVVQTALSYIGTPYRWGGKSPVGIDCSGLCSMSYMIHGVIIYRDAKVMEGFPVKEIPLEQIKKGDLIFFPGHIAMYIEDGLYVHSSLGGNEVNCNSLNEKHPLYREDLAKSILTIGSIF